MAATITANMSQAEMLAAEQASNLENQVFTVSQSIMANKQTAAQTVEGEWAKVGDSAATVSAK